MALESVIFQTLSFSNFRYIWLDFLWLIYITIFVFCTELTHMTQKLKKLDETYGTKLNSNWNPN